MTEKLEIKNYDLERSFVAQMVNNRANYLENTHRVNDGLFRENVNARGVFTAFVKLLSDNLKVDAINLSKHSGISLREVVDLLSSTEYYYDFDTLLDTLEGARHRAELESLSIGVSQALRRGDDVSGIVKTIEDTVSLITTGGAPSYRHVGESVRDLLGIMDRNASGQGLTGLRTGFSWLDGFTGGLQRSDLVVLAGRTSQGKTSLALNIALNASRLSGAKVGVFSLEMSEVQLTARLCANVTGISGKKMLFGKVSGEEMNSFLERVDELTGCGIYINAKNTGRTQDLINQVRFMKLALDVDIVIVDYLQLISTGGKDTPEQDAAKTARGLKNVAMELNMTVILLSQLKRSNSTDQYPTLSDLRNSGQIEEAADVVMFVYRPKAYEIETINVNGNDYDTNGLALLNVAKGRNIGTGKCVLGFDEETTLFSNYQGGPGMEYIQESWTGKQLF